MKSIGDTLTKQELTDLGDLVGHPGWRLFEALVESEWGAEAFAAKVSRSLGQPKTSLADKELALAQLEQATVSRDAVVFLMKWPREQVQKARAQAPVMVASMNRGGV
jgi:hypothetical protein